MLKVSFQIVYGDDNSTVLGTTPKVFPVRSWVMDCGVTISDHDMRSAHRVIIIGQTLAEQHYVKRDSIGQVLRSEGRPVTVIGVLAGTGRTLDGTDLGERLIAPITAVPVRMPQPGIAETGATISAGLSVGLGVIGAISLLVGGIGIMNRRLVSVSERVRETGIHMAIGAKPWHVLAQFLSEAVVMCIVGGLVGLVGVTLAWGGAIGVNSTGTFEMALGVSHVLTAVSTAIGLFFGWYPARRASKLLPIECLRAD